MPLSRRNIALMSVPAIHHEFDRLIDARPATVGFRRALALYGDLITRNPLRNRDYYTRIREWMRISLQSRRDIDNAAIAAMHDAQRFKRPYTMTRLSARPGVTFNENNIGLDMRHYQKHAFESSSEPHWCAVCGCTPLDSIHD